MGTGGDYGGAHVAQSHPNDTRREGGAGGRPEVRAHGRRSEARTCGSFETSAPGGASGLRGGGNASRGGCKTVLQPRDATRVPVRSPGRGRRKGRQGRRPSSLARVVSDRRMARPLPGVIVPLDRRAGDAVGSGPLRMGLDPPSIERACRQRCASAFPIARCGSGAAKRENALPHSISSAACAILKRGCDGWSPPRCGAMAGGGLYLQSRRSGEEESLLAFRKASRTAARSLFADRQGSLARNRGRPSRSRCRVRPGTPGAQPRPAA